jgi:transcription elongation factor Elf1
MRILKLGKPWSTEIICSACTSILRVTADSLEFHDVKSARLGVGFTCTVCDSKEVMPTEIPPVVDDLLKRRRGLAPKRPEIIKKAQPKNFQMICGNCEAELLIEPQDIKLMLPNSFRTYCAACLSLIELSSKDVPDEIREMLQLQTLKSAKAETLFDEATLGEPPAKSPPNRIKEFNVGIKTDDE